MIAGSLLSLTRWTKVYRRPSKEKNIRGISCELCGFSLIDNLSFIATHPSEPFRIRRYMLCDVSEASESLMRHVSLGFDFHEAVFRMSLVTRTPIVWSTDLKRDLPIPASWLHFGTCDETLLTDGISFGFRTRHELKFVLSFAVRDGTIAQRDIHCVVPHIYATIHHLNRFFDLTSEKAAQKWELSNRERECLGWLIQGKTLWEIGVILTLSERTVRFHIDNVVSRLACTNRTQAIAKAIYYGLNDIIELLRTSDMASHPD